ncbi:MAG: DUF1697 domain-containing protein [Crocinitomicaceae bacterium]|nr:DUF1697 domain-containing protein [Crocinitomicaceae bacterium]
MNNYASLIRGINVSGKNIVKMAELRTALEKAGLKEVQTYIQSGNILFSSEQEQEYGGEIIRNVLDSEFDVQAPVVTFDLAYLEKVMEANPYKNEDPKKVAIGFLNTTPEIMDLPGVVDEKYAIGENCIYLFYPSGMGKSKLSNAVIEKKMNVVSTMRNLNTCGKLVDLLRQG